MAPPFIFPSNLEDLEEDPDDNRLAVSVPVDVTVLRPSELDELVNGVAYDLSDKDIFCIEDQDVFDRVYSVIKGFSYLSPSCKYNLIETIRSNLAVLLPNVDALSRAPHPSTSNSGDVQIPIGDRIASYRNALKIYTYFLANVIILQESKQESGANSKVHGKNLKKASTTTWNPDVIRGRIINLIANSLEINLALLFGSSGTDGSYISFVSKFAFSLLENQALLKDATTKDGLGRIVGSISTKHNRATESCASILHLIYKFDFTVPHLAEMVAAAEKKYCDGTLVVALIREIGRTDPKDYARDAVGAENVGRFIVSLADRMPKLMYTNVGILVSHFGGESYKIRNALVGVLGKLVAKAFKDLEGDQSSKIMHLRGKQAMLDILIERAKDVSAYTRSRVLQVWAELCEERAVSIGLWNELASVASGRLEDKSAIVRKSALNILVTMLQHNPFGPQLRTASFEATLEKYKEKLQALEPARTEEHVSDSEIVSGEGPSKIGNGVGDGVDDGDDGDTLNEESLVQLEESVSDSVLSSSQGQTQENTSVPDIGNLEQLKALVASLDAGLQFSKCIASTMPILVQLLASSSATDVENVIILLMRCRQFQIDGAEKCLLKMLPLVFSQDKSIYEAVENAFVSIYIRKVPSEISLNLLNLVINSSIGDLAALEYLIGSLVYKGEISQSTISAFWDYFSFNISGVVASQSRGALSVLCMAAKSTPGILSSHLQEIIDIGFGRWAKVEPLLARTACIALERLPDEDKEKLRINGSKVFGVLESLVTGLRLPESIWYTAVDKAICTIYSIHPTPETFVADLVKKSLTNVFSCSADDEAACKVDKNNEMKCYSVSTLKLGRFFFIISQIALHHLVYIESCTRKIRLEKSKKEKVKSESEVVDGNSNDSAEVLGINAELGIGASDDVIIDSLSEKAEKEIVSSNFAKKYLIGYCAPFLSMLCRNIKLLEKYPKLQASTMLALCRLMIIDADFCEENLQLLFTVVESATSETVRSNCTVALGDLAARFPNLMEPWTENMYARLRDPSTSVRKNAVLVLSHLILNDMMKVKGYIDEMAIRIEDKDERISSLAKLFFHELSKKGNNPVYSLLPDILGRLFSQNLEEEAFFNIVQFLITSIKKEKQMESLVEKLCNRFGGVYDAKQWECIAYCLSQLTFTEKGLKKLVESFKSYQHVLCEDSVLDYFRAIISKCKKFAKPELKSCVEEFEEKLNRFHVERKEQDATAQNAMSHQKNVAKVEGLLSAKNGTVENGRHGNNVEDEASEIINPSQSEESTLTSITTDEVAYGSEVLSPRTSRKGISRSRLKQGKLLHIKEQKDSNPVQSNPRKTRRRGGMIG